MNRTQKFALNSITTAFYQIVTMGLGFITPALMIQTYGSEINGLVSSINQLISYISLVEAGLSGAAVFSLYKPLADQNYNKINAIISAAKKYYIKTGYVFSAATMILAVAFALLKNISSLTRIEVFILVLLLSINGCIDFFVLARYRVILTADQRTYIISILSTIQVLVKAAVIIICCNYRLNILLLYILALSPILIKISVLFFFTNKYYPYLNFNEKPNEKALGRRYDVIYQQILGTVQTSAPTVIATIFLDLITVSVYSIYNMVLSGINGVLSIFISGLPAGFGEIIVKKEYNNLKKNSSEFEVAYYYILSIVYGLTMVLILPFISIYTKNFTDANYYIPSLAFLIVLNGICYSVKTPQSMLMIAAGLYKEQRWKSTIQASIIIIGGCLLAQGMGLQGIMIASICSNIYRTIDLMLYVPKHITHNSIKRTARRIINVFFNVAIICIPLIVTRIEPNTYLEWIKYAIVVGLYAVIVVSVVTFIMDRTEFISLIKRFNIMFKRGE